MDIPQTRSLLQKITQLVDSVEFSNTGLSRLERDLLLEYTRRLYDTLATDTPVQAKQEVPILRSIPVSESVPLEGSPAPAAVESSVSMAGSVSDRPESESVTTGWSTPASTPEPFESEQASIPEIQVEAAVEAVPTQQKSARQEEAPHPASTSVPAVSIDGISADLSALFVQPEARDLGDKLRLSRIEDLSRAMGINERFLTINELFGGSHETFDKVLRQLNGLSSFEEARGYLEQEVIPTFNWMDDKKQKKAVIFIQLVKRRYL